MSRAEARPVRLAWPERAVVAPARGVPARALLARRGRGEVAGPKAATLVHADAVDGLDALLARGGGGSVDLIYLDPPFGTGDHQGRRLTLGLADGDHNLTLTGYDDALPLADWLEAMEAVLTRCHAALAPHGTLYLHIDWRRGAYLRLLLDEIFGSDALRNEVIWAYGLGGSSRDRFARKHDVLLVYGRDPARTFFRPVYEAATSSRLRGQPKLARDVWISEDTAPEAPLRGAWTDTLFEHTLSNRDPQRTGYPTQKPNALADRIVDASLPEGGLVLEPMCGSASVGVAGLRRGGRALLVDRNPVALDVARGRVEALGLGWQLEAVVDAGEAARLGAGAGAFDVELAVDDDGVTLAHARWRVPAADLAAQLRAADAAQVATIAATDARALISAWGVGRRQGDDGAVALVAFADRAHCQRREADDAGFARLARDVGHTASAGACVVVIDLFGAVHVIVPAAWSRR